MEGVCTTKQVYLVRIYSKVGAPLRFSPAVLVMPNYNVEIQNTFPTSFRIFNMRLRRAFFLSQIAIFSKVHRRRIIKRMLMCDFMPAYVVWLSIPLT